MADKAPDMSQDVCPECGWTGKRLAQHMNMKHGSAPSGPAVKGGRATKLEKQLAETLTSLGVVVYAFDQFDGQTIIEGAPRLAASLDNLARQNPTVKATLERMLAGSAYGAVAASLGSILVPILAHHGLLPALPGILPPPEGESGDG